MASNNNDISVLNSLIASTLDSVEGYRESAKDAEDPQLKSHFGERANERTQVVSMLRDQVRTLGGTPEDDGTILGGAHRMFVNLKSKIASRDDQAVLEEVRRGETHLMEKFEEASGDNDMSSETLQVIKQAHSQIASGHAQMQGLGSTATGY
jgi:uncharacterized protein (TIGR02284 family)